MSRWEVNKGVGRPLEFKGLKAQYIFILIGGLFAIFILATLMILIGLPQVISVGVGVLGASILLWQTFRLNNKYGAYGLMKLRAKSFRPYYLSIRKSARHLVLSNKDK